MPQATCTTPFHRISFLDLFPPEMIVKRALGEGTVPYSGQPEGAILYIQEVSGSEEAEYIIRVIQSDGRLEYEATEKMPDGGMNNVVYQTEGPTVVCTTTII
jgi:hypothetical protein